MELRDKKIILLRFENVLASFPIGRRSPKNCTDIRLNSRVVNQLRNMPELFRVAILYDKIDTIDERESFAIIKATEFHLFCLLAVAVDSKSAEQRTENWLWALKSSLPKGLSASSNFLFVGSEDDKALAHELRIDYLSVKEFICYDKGKAQRNNRTGKRHP